MAFDISRLSNAVNKYLNSISDVANAAKKSSQEIEERTRFATDLKDAIRQNIEARTRNDISMPDIAAQVKEQVAQATSAIDSQIQQINGSFEAIRGARAATSGSNAGLDSADSNASAASSLAKAVAASANGQNVSNYDAYNGMLSTEALQELSKSQYFSSNLIQSSLFDVLKQDENGSSGNSLNSGLSVKTASSAFDSLSLSDRNINALLQAAGLTSSSSDTASNSTTDSTLQVTSQASSQSSSSDLAKALIKAYTANGSSLSATSIFGDFSL